MEDLATGILRDLPSTALLLIFIYYVSKQFDRALNLLSNHLDQLNALIRECIKSKDLDEKEREIQNQISKLETMITHFTEGRFVPKSPERSRK